MGREEGAAVLRPLHARRLVSLPSPEAVVLLRLSAEARRVLLFIVHCDLARALDRLGERAHRQLIVQEVSWRQVEVLSQVSRGEVRLPCQVFV